MWPASSPWSVIVEFLLILSLEVLSASMIPPTLSCLFQHHTNMPYGIWSITFLQERIAIGETLLLRVKFPMSMSEQRWMAVDCIKVWSWNWYVSGLSAVSAWRTTWHFKNSHNWNFSKRFSTSSFGEWNRVVYIFQILYDHHRQVGKGYVRSTQGPSSLQVTLLCLHPRCCKADPPPQCFRRACIWERRPVLFLQMGWITSPLSLCMSRGHRNVKVHWQSLNFCGVWEVEDQ